MDQAIRLFRSSPEFRSLVRQQLLGSGMTPDEIRRQLSAAGYPPDLLDDFLATEQISGAQTDEEMLQAISALSRRDAGNGQGTGAGPRSPQDTASAAVQDDGDRAAARAALPVFGLDVFGQESSEFEPVVSGPVDGSYHLGAGDVVVLIITGSVEVTHELEVTRQGFMLIPRVGQVYVNSLSLDQARSVLYDRLGEAYSGISRSPTARTQFDILVANVRSQTIRVIGEVVRPGSYQVAATGGVLNALYRAGGITERGSFRQVEVRRGRNLIETVDLYDYLLRGIVPADVPLQPGDVVFVPPHGPWVKIAGEVRRPAVYELRSNETLRDLVRLAGGLTPVAATDAATVDRVLPPDERPEPGNARRVLTVSLRALRDSTVPTVSLLAADSVTVFPIRGGRRNSVAISGAVWEPGTYELEPEMRLWDLIEASGGLRPDTYEGRVQLLRLQPDSSRQLYGYLLDDPDNPSPANDAVLREGDQVTVFSRAEFRPRRYVTVQGAVRKPGVVVFSDSMTLRDAVLLAGGLTDNAYLLEAELSRVRPDFRRDSDSLATILKVPMDSTYVFDGSGYVRRPTGTTGTTQVVLYPYDNVFIRRQPGWEVQRNVVVTGEVRFPGTYTLAVKDEKLSSIIDRAGGLKQEAYPAGIQFVRKEENVGPVAVNLPAVLSNPNHRDNLALAPGDSIHIPRFIPTVKVDGAVNAPASVTYVPGAGIDFYIDGAGGVTYQADKGRTYIRQPNGYVERSGRPQPGSVVFVPQKDPTDRGLLEFLPFFTAFVSVASTTATLIIALRR